MTSYTALYFVLLHYIRCPTITLTLSGLSCAWLPGNVKFPKVCGHKLVKYLMLRELRCRCVRNMAVAKAKPALKECELSHFLPQICEVGVLCRDVALLATYNFNITEIQTSGQFYNFTYQIMNICS